MNNELKFMRRAIALAKRGEGLTRPNPPVGAVVVKNGKIIGEGWHKKAGGPHAEIFALRHAGAAARGATLYVTLEPCSTFGRTPPCTGAILAAGISRVVIACRDPNPNHAGRGLRLMKKNGIEVCSAPVRAFGAKESPRGDATNADAKRLIEPFEMWMTKKRPFVTLKLAITLDGKIADAAGHSQWITGEASRKLVQDLRRRADAIMVGVGTLNADDPSLLPRPDKGRRPWRVIVDTKGRANHRAQVFNDDAAARTLIASAAHGADSFAQTISLPKKDGHVSLSALMAELGSLGILHVVCEGGGELASSLVRGKLVDELWLFIAPKIIGGRKAKPAFGGSGWLLKNAPAFQISDCRKVGNDLLVIAR